MCSRTSSREMFWGREKRMCRNFFLIWLMLCEMRERRLKKNYFWYIIFDIWPYFFVRFSPYPTLKFMYELRWCRSSHEWLEKEEEKKHSIKKWKMLSSSSWGFAREWTLKSVYSNHFHMTLISISGAKKNHPRKAHKCMRGKVWHIKSQWNTQKSIFPRFLP